MFEDFIYTDDEAKAQPFEYRGPVGVELPPARPAAYGVLALLTIACWFLVWLLAPTFWFGVLGFLLSPAVAIWITRKVMGHVDYYRPVRHWLTVWRAELYTPRRTRPHHDARETTLESGIFKEGPRR